MRDESLGGRFSDDAEVPPWIPLKNRPPPEDPPYELPLNPDPFPKEEGDRRGRRSNSRVGR